MFSLSIIFILSSTYEMRICNYLSLIICVLLFVFILSCSTNEEDLETQILELEDEIENLTQINNLLNFKVMIAQANECGSLIKTINQIDNEIILEYEDGLLYEVNDDIVLNHSIDTANWMVNLELIDASSISTGFLGNDFYIENNQINVNPYGNAPLTAVVEVETPVKGKFIVKVLGVDGEKSNITLYPDFFGKHHLIKIYGMYSEFNNQVELIFTNKDGVERKKIPVSIMTEELQEEFPEIDIVKNYSPLEENVLFLVNYRPIHIPFMVDPFGKVRWYSTGFSTDRKFALQMLRNGNLAYGKAGEGSIIEYTIMGDFVSECFFNPDYVDPHHDVLEIPNGNFLITVSKVGNLHPYDHIIELDRQNQTINNVWNLAEILPKDRYTLRKIADGQDWIHTNAVIYDESDNSIIVSSQPQGIFKITWDNKLKWILSPPEGWSYPYSDYVLRSSGVDFDWSWGQHSPAILPDGNLLVFDNGYGRDFGEASSDYSRAVEYSISENNNDIGGYITQEWEYGKERGDDMFFPFVSDVDYLEASENILITAGSTSFDLVYVDSLTNYTSANTEQIETRIIEVNNSKEVKFEMTFRSDLFTGTTYRTEKIILK